MLPVKRCSLRQLIAPLVVLLAVAGCAGTPTVELSSGHLVEDPEPARQPPPAVVEAPVVPEPVKAPPVETYTVVVKDVPVVDLLFSLARDANLDVDIQSSANKTVTINAVQRPLQEILSRIADQARLRYRLNGTNLLIQDDLP
ncbi:MAG: type II and III secretion system protein, partial [Woeseiaceae bacterium]